MRIFKMRKRVIELFDHLIHVLHKFFEVKIVMFDFIRNRLLEEKFGWTLGFRGEPEAIVTG